MSAWRSSNPQLSLRNVYMLRTSTKHLQIGLLDAVVHLSDCRRQCLEVPNWHFPRARYFLAPLVRGADALVGRRCTMVRTYRYQPSYVKVRFLAVKSFKISCMMCHCSISHCRDEVSKIYKANITVRQIPKTDNRFVEECSI